MKQAILLFIFSSALFLSGCLKNNGQCSYGDSSLSATAAERQQIKNYLTFNGLTATEAPNGLFYSIPVQGSGASINNLCSSITVRYIGKLTDGTVFDSTPNDETRKFTLASLIVGWQTGMPKVNKGGRIILYVPPTLGYGQVQQGSVPANSILIFDIDLLDITNY